MTPPLLRVENLEICFHQDGSLLRAVRDVSLEVRPGEALALVGESGCGKSVTALSIMGLLPGNGQITRGSIQLGERDLRRLAPEEFRRLRGAEIGMVFQEPMTSLDPVFTIGYQLAEALDAHLDLDRADVRARSIALLKEVGIAAPEARLRAYPGQLSGGLCQRVMIAIALSCRPRLLIADEPTTALDVTIQAQIMALLARLRDNHGTALLLITHDLGLVAQNVDRVLVMYAGHVVEEASTPSLFSSPLHPYTRGLLASLPGAGNDPGHGRLQAIPGNVPHPAKVPAGCPFRDRCLEAVAACAESIPTLEEKRAAHRARCIRVERRV